MAEYLRPETLKSALDALGGAPWSVLAGGTDFYPARVDRALQHHDPLRKGLGVEAIDRDALEHVHALKELDALATLTVETIEQAANGVWCASAP